MDKPTMGRIVRYVGHGGGTTYAAIITAVDEASDTISLHVFPPAPSGDFGLSDVPYDEDKRPTTWHWPTVPRNEPTDLPPPPASRTKKGAQ